MRVLVLLLVAAAATAEAHEIQFEWGQCRFGLERDGTFYQSDRYHQNYMTPGCGGIGIADRFTDGPFGWRVAFLATRSIEARDNVATLFDQDAFRANLVCHNASGPPGRGRGCIASFRGNGHTWGFSFSATYERRLGPIRAVAETGLFFFRHSMHAEAEHIDCTTCRKTGNYDESSGPFTAPIPLVGLTLRLGHVYAAARYYWPAEHRALSLTNHSFSQFSSGVIFPY